MREVAGHLQMALASVFAVYQALEREGLITRMRGANTMLSGKEVSSRQVVRGVIGISVWLPAMISLPYTGTLTIELEEHLRHFGYVADFIFHRHLNEEAQPEFLDRFLNHQLDAVIIHTPPPSSRQNILSLRERGTRAVVLTAKGSDWNPPGIVYLLDSLPAYHQLAAQWRKRGIRKVWLWNPPGSKPAEKRRENLAHVFEKHGLQPLLSDEQPTQFLKAVEKGAKKMDSAVALGITDSDICNHEPLMIERISQVARLGFLSGRIYAPFMRTRNILVDIVDYSPIEIASRLAEDIHRLSVLPDGTRHTFVAKYHEQIGL